MREAGFVKVEVRGKTGDGGIDGERLAELLKHYELGIKTEMIEKVTIKDGWFQAI